MARRHTANGSEKTMEKIAMPDKKELHYRVGGHLFLVREDGTTHYARLMPSMQPFEVEGVEEKPVFTLSITRPQSLPIPSEGLIGSFDCGGCLHDVYDLQGEGYCIVFHHTNGDCCGCLLTDHTGEQATVCLHGDHIPHQQFALGNATMIAYAYATAKKQTVLMHASVVSLEGKGYLMTAPSGTGKSTHTALWRKCFGSCELVNDDNPVVRIEQGKAIVYGSPWSGKTPCYRNVCYPVGAYVRLFQEKENNIHPYRPLEAYAMLLPAMSCMVWDKRMQTGVSGTVAEMVRLNTVYRLGCRPDEAAARICRATIQ